MHTASAQLALALSELDGVGRVTSNRILREVSSYDELRTYPHEQLLYRLKGTPKASRITKTLLDEDTMRPLLDNALESLSSLGERGVHVLTPAAEVWPSSVDELPRRHRPAYIYVYGPLEMLERPRIAFFARPPLDSEPFEAAQSLLQALFNTNAMPVAGTDNGFDVVIHKRAAGWRGKGSTLVAKAGLQKVPRPIRPVAGATVRSGGMLISSFPMAHGPFDHDDVERALLQAALADVCLFFNAPDGSPEAKALQWVSGTDRPLYYWADSVDEEPSRGQAFKEWNDEDELVQLVQELEA